MIALKLLKILRDDYIHGELDKDINEAIAELKAMNLTRREWYQKGFNEAMNHKTCDTCTYFDNELWGGSCLNFGFRCTSAGAEAHRPDDGFCCNRYEPKDNA